MIKIICLGKIKEQYLKELIEDYKTRILKYHKIEIIELKDENDLALEKDNILRHISPRDFVIACDKRGSKLNSEDLAKLIDETFMNHGTISFIIGSSEGLHEDVTSRANLKLSFSDFTMPHGLFRGVLLEQIYRSFKINNNETYHK